MNAHLARAEILFQQSRYEEAETECRRALGEDPQFVEAMTLLAFCLSERDKHDEALRVAAEAISLEPDNPETHYTLAHVQHDRKKDKLARQSIEEAIRLDPYDVRFHALLAAIHAAAADWNAMLESAEKGLAVDPDDAACGNLRGMALTKLGRADEAHAGLDDNLSRDPDNSMTHANKGWACLHQGDPKTAMVHFREALRLDPTSEFARGGMLQALKARHWPYRILLKYFLWMSTLSRRAQWGVVIGLYVLFRVLMRGGETNPDYAGYIWPLLYLYIGFVFLTWTASPLFNLLLRLHPFGRYVLSDTERRAATATGVCLAAGVTGIVCGFALYNAVALILGIICVVMVIPVSAALGQEPGRARTILGLYTLALWALGLGGVLLLGGPGAGMLQLFFVGFLVFQFVANAVR